METNRYRTQAHQFIEQAKREDQQRDKGGLGCKGARGLHWQK